MARVWRDGQKLPVTIYRLLATATIDEKIFQRQLKKLEVGWPLSQFAASFCSCTRSIVPHDRYSYLNQVSDTVIETKSNVQRNFNVKNLKELFQL